jgi:hypothetical protein
MRGDGESSEVRSSLFIFRTVLYRQMPLWMDGTRRYRGLRLLLLLVTL